MSDDYNGARDGHDSYALAIRALREINVRAGRLAPRTDDERRQADSGPVPNDKLDAVRCA